MPGACCSVCCSVKQYVIVCVCDVDGVRMWAVCHIAIVVAECKCLWCVAVCVAVCYNLLQYVARVYCNFCSCICCARMKAVCHVAVAAAGSRCLWCVAVCVAVCCSVS